MNDRTRRAESWARAVRAMEVIRTNIENDDTVNITEAGRAVGIAPSSLYRWLNTPPDKIDVASLAGLADWLHEVHGYEDFATIWRRVK